MKKSLTVLVFVLTASLLSAQTVPPNNPQEKTTVPQTKHPYLGVAVEALSPALQNQLSTLLPKGQGILVKLVAKDSPADKAGLRPFDILLTYDSQKLNSPEQLVKMVQSDKPFHEVSIHFLRNGKESICKVMLGDRVLSSDTQKSRVLRFVPDGRFQQWFEDLENQKGNTLWESFDAMKLTRLDNKKWRAEIDFRTKEGKKDHKVFEGTRQEIRKAIETEKDLPANERAHLLRALNLQEPIFHFHFPALDSGTSRFWDDF